MKNEINVRVEVDPACRVPEVVIRTDGATPLVGDIAAAVADCAQGSDRRVAAYRGDTLTLLHQQDIIRAYTEARRVVICARQGEFEAKETLQSLEAALDPDSFLRISRFEIINIRKAERFDFSITGTVSVTFEDGSSTWVARRYVRTVQSTLDRLLGREGGRA